MIPDQGPAAEATVVAGVSGQTELAASEVPSTAAGPEQTSTTPPPPAAQSTATTIRATTTTKAPTTTTTRKPTAPTSQTTARPASAPPPVAATAPAPAPSPPPAPATSAGEQSFLACVRRRESGGNYQVVSANGMYFGAYQFLQSSWDSVARHAGRSDLVGVPPNLVSPADQDAMALALYHWQGSAPWGGACG